MSVSGQDLLRVATVGSVDDGKSSLIGRLLYDADKVYDDQLAAVDRESQRRGEELNLALITDGLRAEREQAITIDVAYRFFSTPRRRFIIADAPGHEQFTRNMVTAASTSNLAVILMDARKGVLDQTRRHAFLCWLLGIRSIIVAVNKMDLVNFDQKRYDSIREEFIRATAELECLKAEFVPICALKGDNVVNIGQTMKWYGGPSLLGLMEVIDVQNRSTSKPLRFPVQYVIRPHQDYRGYAGQVVSGTVIPGMKVVVLPTQQTTRISEVTLYTEKLEAAVPPASVVLQTADYVSLGRGDMLVSPEAMPLPTQAFNAVLIWMAVTPLQTGVPYLIKYTTQQLSGAVTKVLSKLDLQSLHYVTSECLGLNDIGIVQVELHKRVFVDRYSENHVTGSFIVVNPRTNETAAAGLILDPMSNWAGSGSEIARSESHGDRGLTVWFTGLSGAGKSTIANALYTELKSLGLRVELLDADEIRKNLNRDLGFSKSDRDENVRRIGFIADLLTRHGVIVLVAAIAPYRAIRNEIRTQIRDFVEVYVNAPIGVCQQRDPKGLYKKAAEGKLRNLTGLDDPYEEPYSPEICCDTDRESPKESVMKVCDAVITLIKNRAAKNNGAERGSDLELETVGQ